jgi:CBS domain-containing protein
MATVWSVLKNKGNQVWSLSPQATVLDALHLMAEKGVGAVLIMEEDHLVGIFSERDYARRGVLMGRGVDATMEEMMTSPVLAINPDRTMEDVQAIMTERHFRHLPVMENEKVIGLISIGDVVKSIIDEQANHISGLENYIMGRR